MRILNLSNYNVLGEKIEYAESFCTRLKGLMFKDRLYMGEGIILTPCKIIHTFGMRFTLDVIFISKTNEVIHVIEGLQPNCISPFIRKACGVIELPTGTIGRTNTLRGDRLDISVTYS